MAPFISLLPTRRARPSTAAPASPDLDAYFLNSPAAKQTLNNDADISALDWNDLLQAGEASATGMLNEESFRFVADESVATVAGVCMLGDIAEEDSSEVSVQRQEEVQAQVDVVVEPNPVPEPVKKAAPRPRSSLAPLRSVALPLPPPQPASLPLQPAPVVTKPHGKRPRASLSRPAHILPKDHPSHPRQSLAFVPPPLVAEVGEEQQEPPRVPPQPKRSALKQSSSAGSVSQTPCAEPRSTEVKLPACKPLPSIPLPTIAILSESSPAPHDPFGSPGLPFDGDSSLPTIGVPLDLRGCTSTPSRPRGGVEEVIEAVPSVEEEPEVVIEEEPIPIAEPSPKPRRATMAVTFALPDLEDSQETTEPQEVEAEEVQQIPEPATTALKVSTATLKRRASRAFEATAVHDPVQPSLSTSTSRRASRAFASAAPVISATPGLSVSQASSRRVSTSTSQCHADEDRPRTVIRLTASASATRRPRASVAGRVPPSAQPIAASAPAHVPIPAVSAAPKPSTAATTKHTSTTVGLTLPRDFDFLNRGAEREAERKRRAEQREKEREIREKEETQLKRRKTTSAWAVPATREARERESKEKEAKRIKLTASLPPGWPTASSRPSSHLHSSAPAPRQPRSRPTHMPSSDRRRSEALSSDPTNDISSSSLTHEALEAIQIIEGPKLDLKRRVSTYLDGVLPGVEEEEEDSYEVEEKMVLEATAPKEVHFEAAPRPSALVSEVNSAMREAATVVTVSAGPAARRPLGASKAQNQSKQAPAAVAHFKPMTKAQPFTFGTTSHRARVVAPPTGTASPIFTESMSMWKNLEAAALGAPPRMASSFGAGAGVKGVASRAPVSKRTGVPADSGRATEVKSRRIEATLAKRDKENAGKVKATATESKEVLWASTEQRRSEREAWEKKQREREEEVHNVKEKQRKEQAERERLKLKALRDALVIQPHPIPASTYERRAARRG